MAGTRPAAVAGRFYPADPGQLAATVDRLLDQVDVPDEEPLAPGYVVPHAGHVYSGPVAAHVYARLRRHADRVRRVVLLGPAHFVALRGCAAPAHTAWATPLGELPVTDAAPLAAAGHLVIDDRPHAPEHSLEVQLPFLQRALRRPVPILPVAVGTAPADQVAATIAAILQAAGAGDGPGDTVVLCSTDLSHYLDQAAARERDAATEAAIVALAPDRIAVPDACGSFALRGLLTWAAGRGLRPVPLYRCTSADTAGDPAQVVGYAAVALHHPAAAGAPPRCVTTPGAKT